MVTYAQTLTSSAKLTSSRMNREGMTGTGQTRFCPSIQDAHTVHQPKDSIEPTCPQSPLHGLRRLLHQGQYSPMLGVWNRFWTEVAPGGAGTSKRMLSGPFPVTSNGYLEHKARTNRVTWPPFSRQFYLIGGKTLPPWLTKKPPTNSAVHLPASPALPHLLLSRERRQVHHLPPRQVSVFGVNCLKKKGRESLQETKENTRGAERRGWHLVLWVDVSLVALCGRTLHPPGRAWSEGSP